MKLSIATLLVGTAAASNSIRANSKVGRKVMSKARRLDGGAEGMSWAADYSIRFEKCAASSDYYGGYFGGNQDNNNNNNNRNGYNGMYEQRLVHFKLCPTSECGSGSCSGGADYVLDMNEFVESYLEYKVEAQEAECEYVAENCYCENANDDDACAAQCYVNAGIYDQCVEQDNQNNNGQQQDDFELEEAMECRELEIDEDAAQYYAYGQNGDGYNQGNGNYYNGNNNGEQQVQFFVGPYCSANGKSILLGVFMDETCSFEAPDGVYEKFHYGNSLPYSSESIVSHDCISCLQKNDDDNDNNNNNNNQNYNYNNNYNNGNNNNGNNNYNYNQEQEEKEVLEVCERLYEEAGKCETNLELPYGVYPNTLACSFIKGLDSWGLAKVAKSFSEAKKNTTPAVLAGVFAATTAVFGGVSYYFHKKLQRNNVGLVGGQGHIMA